MIKHKLNSARSRTRRTRHPLRPCARSTRPLTHPWPQASKSARSSRVQPHSTAAKNEPTGQPGHHGHKQPTAPLVGVAPAVALANPPAVHMERTRHAKVSNRARHWQAGAAEGMGSRDKTWQVQGRQGAHQAVDGHEGRVETIAETV